MGCNCSSNGNQERLSNSSPLNLSPDQELTIQGPPNSIKIQKIPKFDHTFFYANPSIELKASDSIPIDSLNNTQIQSKTLQNLLLVMNGQVDSIIEKKKGNHSKRRSKAKRVQMEDLEKLF